MMGWVWVGSRLVLRELLPPGMTLLVPRCIHEDGEPLGMLLHGAGSSLPLPKPSCDFSKSHFAARWGRGWGHSGPTQHSPSLWWHPIDDQHNYSCKGKSGLASAAWLHSKEDSVSLRG